MIYCEGRILVGSYEIWIKVRKNKLKKNKFRPWQQKWQCRICLQTKIKNISFSSFFKWITNFAPEHSFPFLCLICLLSVAWTIYLPQFLPFPFFTGALRRRASCWVQYGQTRSWGKCRIHIYSKCSLCGSTRWYLTWYENSSSSTSKTLLLYRSD